MKEPPVAGILCDLIQNTQDEAKEAHGKTSNINNIIINPL